MSAQLKREFGPTVVNFPNMPQRNGYATESIETTASEGLTDRIDQVIAAIEAMSSAFVAQSHIRMPSAFDAIYISSLQPDFVSSAAIERIIRFSSVEDRSHEISFDDGLD